MSAPLVSVVIPCFGYAHVLSDAIDSVLAQDYDPIEIIVIDDESPDNTAEVVARYGDRVIYIRQANAGPGAARNAGIARMQGNYAVFLDADDMLAPTMVSAMMAAAVRSPHGMVFAGAWHDVDVSGHIVAAHPTPRFGDDAMHALLPTNLAPPVCYMFRRSALDRVGGFEIDRRLSGHEDWDLLLRLAADGQQFVSVPDSLSMYRISPHSISSDRARMYRSGKLALVRASARCHGCPECRRRLARSKQGFAVMYVRQVMWPALRHSRSINECADVFFRYARDVRPEPWLEWMVVRHLVCAFPSPETTMWKMVRRLGVPPVFIPPRRRTDGSSALKTATGRAGQANAAG